MRKITSLTLEPQTLIRLKVVAARSGIKVNTLITRAIEDALPSFELQALADAGAISSTLSNTSK